MWTHRYPTQLADLLANPLIAAVLFAFELVVERRLGKARGWPFPGFLFLLYLLLYCIQRFYFEFWRGDMHILFSTFTWTHLYCGLAVLFSAALLWRGFSQLSG